MDSEQDFNPFAAPATPLEQPTAAKWNLRFIAKAQRLLLLSVMISLGLLCITFIGITGMPSWLFGYALFGGWLVAYLLRVIAVGVLATAVKFHPISRIAFVLLAMLGISVTFGLLSLLMMVFINARATRILKAQGIPVGLLGVGKKHDALIRTAQAKLDGTLLQSRGG
jgi:hypothetical protein